MSIEPQNGGHDAISMAPIIHTGLSTPLGTTSLRLNFGGEQGQGMNTAAVDALPAFDSWFGHLRGTVISRVKKIVKSKMKKYRLGKANPSISYASVARRTP